MSPNRFILGAREKPEIQLWEGVETYKGYHILNSPRWGLMIFRPGSLALCLARGLNTIGEAHHQIDNYPPAPTLRESLIKKRPRF